MEVAIVLIIVIMGGVLFWSVKVSKRLSVMIFSLTFLGIAVTMIVWQGFTQQALENIGFIALGLLAIWLRFSKNMADAARARSWLEDKLSQSKYSTCEVCGKKMSYHRTPKNPSQLLFGGLTCENCGAEFDVPFGAFMQK
jgi:hypothetical protein